MLHVVFPKTIGLAGANQGKPVITEELVAAEEPNNGLVGDEDAIHQGDECIDENHVLVVEEEDQDGDDRMPDESDSYRSCTSSSNSDNQEEPKELEPPPLPAGGWLCVTDQEGLCTKREDLTLRELHLTRMRQTFSTVVKATVAVRYVKYSIIFLLSYLPRMEGINLLRD